MKSLTKANVSDSDIKMVCKHAFHSNCKSFYELNDGFYNISFIVMLESGKEVVLKIAPSSDVDILTYEKDIMCSEVLFYELIYANTDIPVPHVIIKDFSLEVIPYPYYFMSKLHGITANKVHIITPAMRKEIYIQKASMLAKLHTIKSDTFGYISMKEQCKNKSYHEVFMVIVYALIQDGHRKNTGFPIEENELLQIFKQCEEAFNQVKIPCLVHYDLWDGNLFLHSEHDMTIVGIIDFERGFYGDPAADFCQVLGYMDLFNEDYFINEYNKYSPMKVYLDQAMSIRIFAYRLYLFTIMHIECFYRDINGSFDAQKKWVAKEIRVVYNLLNSTLSK